MLKRTLLSICLLSFFGFQSIAQTLSVGPMVGINISSIQNSVVTKAIAGMSIGGFANYSINEHFGVGAKLLYSQLGANYTDNSDLIRLHYIQLPLSAIYFFGNNGDKIRPKLYAGPYFGGLLKAKNKIGDDILGSDKKSAYTPIDFGAQGGAGLNILVKSRTWLNLDAGLGGSLNDIFKASKLNYHNINFSLNVGLSFPVGD
ncbi:PorT family protein [Lacihabitans sp. LS3-19]|uniref:porin family protein n=1 Tax=Lacihabitans sp. LS3-19 TaxID=2487335 RepID=UPI0020CD0781|nr:porin family protein [Lacihabitans sp. LS3-19]MCP9768674.1 PorT family protein [Lacihabitans sp. LS3-19]